jgi:hypothetical protein
VEARRAGTSTVNDDGLTRTHSGLMSI